MRRLSLILVLLLLATFSARGAETLRVVSAGPVGELATLAEANEVRVVFSEPMVVVGKIPAVVTAPWFRITPAVKGSFRWSGTTTLIFTPHPKQPLPFATKFDVTIDSSATSVAGNTLDRTYSFSFVTPTIRLLRTNWYRKGGNIDGSLIIALRFNQPVDRDTLLPHLQLRTVTRAFDTPVIPKAGLERLQRLEPAAATAFEAKRQKAARAAASNDAPIFASPATDWDKNRFPPSPDLIVLETKPGIPPDTNIQVLIDDKLAPGPANVRGSAQQFTIQLEPTLFVDPPNCVTACDPEIAIAIGFRTYQGITFDEVRRTLTVTDITDAANEKVLQPRDVRPEYSSWSTAFSLDELGYSIEPARKYAIRIDSSLKAIDGQALGYTWMALIETSRKSAFVSFGEGHGVWESTSGPLLPFHARNYKSVTQWLAPLDRDRLMPAIVRLEREGFRVVPPSSKPVDRTLAPVSDQIQSYGIDIAAALGPDNLGLVWAALNPGEAIPRAKKYDDYTRATLVQVTNLGISVKDSPKNTLVLVTRLDNGQPVAGANVTIRTDDNKVFWTGITDANGIATAENTNLRVKPIPRPDPPIVTPQSDDYEIQDEEWWTSLELARFIVTAEKDGDFAYVGSNWTEGISPWFFNVSFDLSERHPLLRGTIFSDRGVYKLGEEVHLKAIVRSDTPNGIQLLPAGTAIEVVLRDSQNKEVDKRTVTTNEWSSADWVVKLPADAPLGTYRMFARTKDQRLRVYGEFLVAAYRRPDFRVDATLTGPSSLAGETLQGSITARYLFGAPMSSLPVRWTYSKRALYEVPASIRDRWPVERWDFLGYDPNRNYERITISSEEDELDEKGQLTLSLPTEKADGWPFEYRIEGEVTDVTRQAIANRATFRIDPAPWYVGVKSPPFFADMTGIDTEIVAVGIDGLAVPGVDVKINLKQIQWNSVRQSEGAGFYEWQTERQEVDAGEWTIRTTDKPVALKIPLSNGGEYTLIATASDGDGRTTTTRSWFYAVGPGYTAWERYDHNRIDLIPEKKTYRPGETARILIKSPWESATALLTTEREGVRTSTPFELTSTQQTVSVPIREADIPNIYVSVLLVKGRTAESLQKDASDPGKPSFRLGYVELEVEDASKRLDVEVKANREEYRPATKARIEVNVRDAAKKGVKSEVTLWAVDYGVLSLTNYQIPDIVDRIYLQKALQVVNTDSRQRIISRRVLTPKGETQGGGGGADPGAGTIRKDFRVLAFWLGSLVTDERGRARTEITLPESLTTYRIMAVAGDKASRFGWAQDEIRINKPLLLRPAFPRFLSVGDQAFFGSVVQSQLKRKGTATVRMRSLDPSILEITGEQQRVEVSPGSGNEVRFTGTAKAVGTARVQMSVTMSGESDAFEDVIPVRILVTPETVAAYGEAKPTAQETLEVPRDVVPGFGGLRVELSSTAMVGLAEGARYLVEYPYGCAEQRSSRALALMLAADLGEAFKLPGLETANARTVAQTTLNDLQKFQCGDGGFAFWPGDCASVSPYLTSYVVHVYQRAKTLQYRVDEDMLRRAYEYLERNLAEPRPVNEGWWPAYTAWQAFAVKVLAEGGRNVDSHITRLSAYLDRMPVFGISFLADALIAKGERGERLEELRRRMGNAILPEGATAHVEELADPYLLYFWNSNIRSTAIVLGTLVRHGTDEEIVKRMVRWMMQVRRDGRWGNTQENAWAMTALVDYYRKYEAEVPDFAATVNLGNQAILREEFRGRSTESKAKDFSMQEVQRVPATSVTFQRDGVGTLFYAMRLRYAPLGLLHEPRDMGFSLERTYALQNSTEAATSFRAGDLIQVTLTIRNTKERRFVAVTDPIPAGTEPVESWFATTASDLAETQNRSRSQGGGDWTSWFRRGGFDHIERHDDRVELFATRLAEGSHTFIYLLRATTAGTFVTSPLHAEEMYEPEVFGRTASDVVEVKP
jgi:uncharacterized protein YfaS (alpha-2-macroglobulin family)